MPSTDPNLLALALLLLVLGAAPAGLAWLRERRRPARSPWVAPEPVPLFLEQARRLGAGQRPLEHDASSWPHRAPEVF